MDACHEGLAEFFQEIRDKDVVVGEASVNNILYLRQQNLIALNYCLRWMQIRRITTKKKRAQSSMLKSWALTTISM